MSQIPWLVALLLVACPAPPEDAPQQGGPQQGAPPQAGTPQAGTPQAGTPQAGTPQAGTPQAGPQGTPPEGAAQPADPKQGPEAQGEPHLGEIVPPPDTDPDAKILKEGDPGFVDGAGNGQPRIAPGDSWPLLEPGHTQEQVKAGKFFLVQGLVAGECAGDVRVDAISAEPPKDGDPKDGTGPYTSVTPDGSGRFTMALPKGQGPAVIFAICNSDKDDKITGGVDKLSNDSRPITQATEGVNLAFH